MPNTPAATQWIKVSDFVQTEFSLTLHNNTTGMDLPLTEKIEISEFASNGVTLKLPRTAAAQGHHLLIHLKQNRKKEKFTFPPPKNHDITATGKAIEVEPLDPKNNTVRIQFYQFNENQWKDLIADYVKRQREVDGLVKKIQS